MKLAANLFLFIMLCVGLASCNGLDVVMVQTKEPFNVKQPKVQKSRTIEQEKEILSKDYAIAEKALKQAILEKNKDDIRLGLKNQILTIRLKTVEAILELDDETFVPNLIEALQNNQGIIDGGTEMQAFQEDLNKSIVSVLEHLTQLRFKVSSQLSSEDIKEVLDKTRDWYKTHKKDM